MKAKIHTRYKEVLSNGAILSIIIWLLPERTKQRSHGYKYRLNYSAAGGTTLLRYDNETNKGDHVHLGDKEIPYNFESVEKLIEDFLMDVEEIRREK